MIFLIYREAQKEHQVAKKQQTLRTEFIMAVICEERRKEDPGEHVDGIGEGENLLWKGIDMTVGVAGLDSTGKL